MQDMDGKYAGVLDFYWKYDIWYSDVKVRVAKDI